MCGALRLNDILDPKAAVNLLLVGVMVGVGQAASRPGPSLLSARLHPPTPGSHSLSPGTFQLKVNWTGRGLRQAALRPISDSPVECRATRITDSQIGGLK